MLKVVMQEPGDAIWTMAENGRVRVFVITKNGDVVEMDLGLYLKTLKEYGNES